MCPYGRAQWRHLANVIESSICSGDAVLYQIALTTCCYLYSVYELLYIALHINGRWVGIPIQSVIFSGCSL